jgi:hypothetical protein
MADERISTHSVSRDVVETDPIVLRESSTRRLVFLPMVVDSDDPLRGCFVYQRKTAQDQWEDIRTERLNTLKAGEGYQLELRSAEVSTLMEGLNARKALFERHGIVWGDQDFIRKDSLPRIVQSIIDSPSSELMAALAELDAEDVLSLSRKVDVSKLDALLDEWRAHEGDAREGFWQGLLTRNAWVFSQLTGSPVVLLKDKAYVGGKSIRNTGGGEIDYLLANELTDNVSFVEIKTPVTPICAASYRSSGAFALDTELSGGIVQVLGYRERFEKEYHQLRANSETTVFRSYNPRCWLIAGWAADLNEDELRSFELFRNAFAGVHVLTFDEVARRLQGIREALTS